MKSSFLLCLLLVSLLANSQELVTLRVVNKLIKTDKASVCKAYLNENTKTLKLYSVNVPSQTFSLIYGEGGKCILNFYQNGILQASKTIYRRSDLERNDGKLIYSSRTEEILVTLN